MPITAALVEQQRRSTDDITQWITDAVVNGEIIFGMKGGGFDQPLPSSSFSTWYSAYLDWANRKASGGRKPAACSVARSASLSLRTARVTVRASGRAPRPGNPARRGGAAGRYQEPRPVSAAGLSRPMGVVGVEWALNLTPTPKQRSKIYRISFSLLGVWALKIEIGWVSCHPSTLAGARVPRPTKLDAQRPRPNGQKPEDFCQFSLGVELRPSTPKQRQSTLYDARTRKQW